MTLRRLSARGMMVERTEEAVTCALIRLTRDPALRARMGSIGRERALEFGPARFTDSVLEAYRVLLGSA